MNTRVKLVFVVVSVLLFSSCGSKFENYTIEEEVTKHNAILVVNEEPPFTSEGTEENTISFYQLLKEDKLEIMPTTYTIGGINGNICFYSKNGSRVLSTYYDYEAELLTYEIINMISKQSIFKKIIHMTANDLDNCYFFPNLSEYLLQKNDGIYVCNIDNNTVSKIVLQDKIKYDNILFSPDENKMAYIVEKNDEKYIHIYDIPSMKIINEILIGKGNIYLSHWSNNNRITYNYEMDAYAINDDGTNKEYLGKYVFYPIYSPDGRYLIYSKPATFVYIESLLDIEGYEKENELGLYVLDIKTKEVKVIRSESRDLIPIQWIENQL